MVYSYKYFQTFCAHVWVNLTYKSCLQILPGLCFFKQIKADPKGSIEEE